MAVDFVDARGTVALDSQLIRVDVLLEPVDIDHGLGSVQGGFGHDGVFEDDFSELGVEIDLVPQALVVLHGDLLGHSLGQLTVGLHNLEGLGQCEHERRSSITKLRNVLDDGHLVGVLDAVALLDLVRVAGSEDVVLLVAARALEIGHILDEGDGGHLEAIEHLDPFDHVHVTQFLGRRDDDGCRQVQLLAQGELDVSRAWGEVDDEEVELTPVCLSDQLDNQVGNHGAPHDGRLPARGEPIAHALDAREVDGGYLVRVILILVQLRLLGTDHGGQARSVHVSVEQPHFVALLHEREGEVDGHC
uniref:Uncharacterized protein n=1 Tax=Strombidium rassoulzadegani TaxID=1082188 RepID=A0A7S3CTN8_9SPIT|mmetsp:Transcript_8476/g.14240  ORF Transcript_8476/g.14240 Transcript_8476/m.14240 type:complete len:304 (+) Transcript_8476:186-1097(+)